MSEVPWLPFILFLWSNSRKIFWMFLSGDLPICMLSVPPLRRLPIWMCMLSFSFSWDQFRVSHSLLALAIAIFPIWHVLSKFVITYWNHGLGNTNKCLSRYLQAISLAIETLWWSLDCCFLFHLMHTFKHFLVSSFMNKKFNAHFQAFYILLNFCLHIDVLLYARFLHCLGCCFEPCAGLLGKPSCFSPVSY